jgi:hypothetical protein
MHHATPFYKITDCGCPGTKCQEGQWVWNCESWNKKGLETYTSGVS